MCTLVILSNPSSLTPPPPGNTFYTDMDARSMSTCPFGPDGDKNALVDPRSTPPHTAYDDDEEVAMAQPLLGGEVSSGGGLTPLSDHDDATLRQRHRSTSSSVVMALAEGIASPTLEGFVDASVDLHKLSSAPVGE